MVNSSELESPIDPGEFAHAVKRIYEHLIIGNVEPFRGNTAEEVRQAAFGLVLIRRLLDERLKTIELGEHKVLLGFREAYGILDHLMSGSRHPISKHIQGIHSGRFRPSTAPAHAIEIEARKIVVAVVRAYARAADISPNKARDIVIRSAKEVGISLTNPMIRKWDERFQHPDGAAEDNLADPGPDAWASKLSEAGDAAHILAVGQTWIWKWWVVPAMPTP